MTNWRDFPKVELHLHLEGAASPDLIRRLAQKNGASTEGLFNAEGGYACDDFTSFLAAYELMCSVLKGADEYYELAKDVLAFQAANGVIYSEIFLSPPSLCPEGCEFTDILAAVEAGAQDAEDEHGIICRFIPVAVRHHGAQEAMRAAKGILRAPRGRMSGFGLAGDERQFRCADFRPAFETMAEAGFQLTAHAGEFGGPESVTDALNELSVDRIGHGVRAIESPDVVRRLAEEGVCLEVCPSSNIELGVFPKMSDHSFEKLRAAGCRLTISTDDPSFFRSNMTSEYDWLTDEFGYGASDYLGFAQNGVQAAFCDDETRAALMDTLNRRAAAFAG